MVDIDLNGSINMSVGHVDVNDASRKDPELDKLVKCGKIVGYHLSTVEFESGSGSRETDRLVLVFASGLAIKIATFCSGSAENTSLFFQTKSLLEGFDD